MIRNALLSLQSLPRAEREIGGITISLNSARLPWLKEQVREFQQRLMMICDDSEEVRDCVYQLNVQLFPVSRRIDPEPSS